MNITFVFADSPDWTSVLESVSTAISTIIASCAAAYAYFQYRDIKRREVYDYIDSQLTEILKIQIEYSHLRDAEYCEYIINCTDSTMLVERRQYDAYCCLVWNTLETMYEKYGEKELRRSSFFAALGTLAKRHKTWIFKNGAGFKPSLITMMLNEGA